MVNTYNVGATLKNSKIRVKRQTGFTIIEIMVVLAVAGVLIMIILLAVPTLEKRERDYERKHYAALVLAQKTEYTNETNNTLNCPPPKSIANCGAIATGANDFITHYMLAGSDGYQSSTSVPFTDPNICTGTSTPTNSVILCWNNTFTHPLINHTQKPKVGQIIIAINHVCLSSTVPNLGDGNESQTAVLIGLENSRGYFCVNN